MRDGEDVGRVEGEGAAGTGDAAPASGGAPGGAAAPGEADNGPVPPLDRLRQRLERRLGGRPLSAYGVLLAGFVVLLGLLAVVFLTSVGEDDRDDGPVCFEAQLDRFREQLYAGEVRRIRVVVPEERREFGVARVRIDYLDGKCADLPQGYAGRDAADQALDMVTTYNQTS